MSTDTLRIMCPSLSCRRILAVPQTSRGKNVRCKNCGTTIRVPDRSQVKAEPPPSQDGAGSKSNAA